tara:strand:+ start:609 stop:719 length:111 start_codon:yes stop_codon:yes gene_type:complete
MNKENYDILIASNIFNWVKNKAQQEFNCIIIEPDRL